jgi:hypothetical protein
MEAKERLETEGFQSEVVTGSSNKNEQIDRFARDDVKILINCMVLTEGFDCLDNKSEILTDSGWKGIGNISTSDHCYSLNRTSGEMELIPVLNYAERYLAENEKMVSLKSQHIDMLTTGNHEYHFKYRDPKKKGTLEARLSDNFITLKAENLLDRRGEIQLPLSSEMRFPGIGLTPNEIKFLAWTQTDGYITKCGAVEITQSNNPTKHVSYIRKLLQDLGYKYTETEKLPTEGSFSSQYSLQRFYVHKESLTNISDLLSKTDNSVLASYNTMTREEFDIFYKEMLKGNGSNYSGKKSGWLWLPYKQQCDNFQAMAIIRGFACNSKEEVTKNGTKVYRMSARNKKWLGMKLSDSRAAKVNICNDYVGKVWCVANKNGTIVVRRNGKTAILGNCPSLQTVFCRDSGKGVTMQMCGRAFRKWPGIKIKNVVQSKNTKWPFVKTADPEMQYLWQKNSWRGLKLNEEIGLMQQNILWKLARTSVILPDVLNKKKTPARRNFGR